MRCPEYQKRRKCFETRQPHLPEMSDGEIWTEQSGSRDLPSRSFLKRFTRSFALSRSHRITNNPHFTSLYLRNPSLSHEHPRTARTYLYSIRIRYQHCSNMELQSRSDSKQSPDEKKNTSYLVSGFAVAILRRNFYTEQLCRRRAAADKRAG